MSITNYYRVRCSGYCGYYLYEWQRRNDAAYGCVQDAARATEYPDWRSAQKAAADAGWGASSPLFIPICTQCKN